MLEKFKQIISLVTGTDVNKSNPSLSTFEKLDKPDTHIDENSIFERMKKAQIANVSDSEYSYTNIYNTLINGSVSENKLMRLNSWRSLARLPEFKQAIDEIVENCIHTDAKGEMHTLQFNSKFLEDLSEDAQKNIMDEYYEFMSMFNFEEDAYEYYKNFLINGELTWENVINSEKPELGIIGLRRIAPECYEYIITLDKKIEGIILNAMLDNESNRGMLPQGGSGVKQNQFNQISSPAGMQGGSGENVMSNLAFNYIPRSSKVEMTPLLMSQITHVISDETSDDKTVVYPFLEAARRPYRQMSLLEDSTIIWQIARSPERYVFNVDVGKLNASRASQLLYNLAQKYKTKKVYNPDTGTVTNDYDPYSIVENFWFAKPAGSKGTEVTTIGSAGNREAPMEPLKYFQKKFYKALRIPFNRIENPKDQIDRTKIDSSYEEQKFCQFCIRVQSLMARGVKQSFITHLKLKGLWEQLKLRPNMFFIKFNPPAIYELRVKQELVNIRIDTFKKATDETGISKFGAMREYLAMTDSQIHENNQLRLKEALAQAYIEQMAENYKGKLAGDNAGSKGALGEMPGGEPEAGGDLGGLDLGGGDMTPPDMGGEAPPSPEGGETPPGGETPAPEAGGGEAAGSLPGEVKLSDTGIPG